MNMHTDRVLEFFRNKKESAAMSYEDHTGKDPFD